MNPIRKEIHQAHAHMKARLYIGKEEEKEEA